MLPSLTELTATQPEPVAAVTGNKRQQAVLLFILILFIGVVAALSYLVGRISEHPESALASGGEQVIVVDRANSLEGKAHPVLPPPPPTQIVNQPASQIVTAKPLTLLSSGLQQPRPVQAEPATAKAEPAGVKAGQTYFQVAAVDRGMAEVSKEYLIRKGLPGLVGDSPSPGVHRVLVGPLAENDVNRVRRVLEEAGFRPFLKNY